MTATFAGLDLLDPQTPPRAKILLMGAPGTGKSYAASTIAGLGKTLYVDMPSEDGRLSFRGAEWASNIDAVRVTNLADLEKVRVTLARGGHGYEAVVLDSISAVHLLAKRLTMGMPENDVAFSMVDKNAQIQQYGTIVRRLEEVALFWFGLASGPNPIHVVMTAQPKTYDDPVAETTIVRPDVQNGAVPKILSTPDFVLYTTVEEVDDERPWEHVLYLGANPLRSTKARIPADKHGKLPYRLTGKQINLARIAKALGLSE